MILAVVIVQQYLLLMVIYAGMPRICGPRLKFKQCRVKVTDVSLDLSSRWLNWSWESGPVTSITLFQVV